MLQFDAKLIWKKSIAHWTAKIQHVIDSFYINFANWSVHQNVVASCRKNIVQNFIVSVSVYQWAKNWKN